MGHSLLGASLRRVLRLYQLRLTPESSGLIYFHEIVTSPVRTDQRNKLLLDWIFEQAS